ncbi:MAG: HD domain-containing protein [Candidatus Atribacteria bacterium]|nr:HD domain-containing protein [Candidatus Atribacteria bacterium]
MAHDVNWYWQKVEEGFHDDVHMIDHTKKVLEYAQQILSDQTGMSEEEKRRTEVAVLLHDIGILVAEKKYGSKAGKFQHIEEPPLVREITKQAEEDPEFIKRVAYIVGNHHNFSKADGIDFQILIEADMLVNLQNEKIKKNKLEEFIDKFFKTKKGRELARKVYL